MAMFPLSQVQLSTAEQGRCGCMTRSTGDKNTLNIIPSSGTKSDGDIISTFLKSREIFNSGLSDGAGLYLTCCSRRSPHWERSEKKILALRKWKQARPMLIIIFTIEASINMPANNCHLMFVLKMQKHEHYTRTFPGTGQFSFVPNMSSLRQVETECPTMRFRCWK